MLVSASTDSITTSFSLRTACASAQIQIRKKVMSGPNMAPREISLKWCVTFFRVTKNYLAASFGSRPSYLACCLSSLKLGHDFYCLKCHATEGLAQLSRNKVVTSILSYRLFGAYHIVHSAYKLLSDTSREWVEVILNWVWGTTYHFKISSRRCLFHPA